MSMNYIWDGFVAPDGRLEMDKPEELRAHKLSLAGKRIQLTLEEYRDKRSLNQNAYFHGPVLDIISRSTGQDRETIKEYLKEEFGVKVYFNGKWLRKSTARYSKQEMMELLDKTIAWAAQELNINIPSPDEVEVNN